jgi:hypothetical protein
MQMHRKPYNALTDYLQVITGVCNVKACFASKDWYNNINDLLIMSEINF